jgi:hypothetical protein
MLIKEDADKLMELKGETKGVTFQTDAEYVKKNWGQPGLEKLKNELDRLGYPIDYEAVKALEWYPMGLRILSLRVIKDLFGLDDQGIKSIGNNAPKVSFVIKMFMKFFISIPATFAQAAGIWRKHYSLGTLQPEVHEDEKYTIFHLRDVDLPPELLSYIEGYFERVGEYLLGPGVECHEEVSQRKQGEYFFRLSWK